MASHGLLNCVDILIVGRLGPGAVASVTAAGILHMVPVLIFTGVANLLAALVANLVGAGRHAAAAAAAGEGLRLALVAWVVLGGLMALAAGPLIGRLEADPATEAAGVLYLRIMSAGSGTLFLLLAATSALRGAGDSVRPMVALVLANVVNLGLDILLVFGLAGFPRLEVAGAAWATVIAQALGAAWILVAVRRRSSPLRPDRVFVAAWTHLGLLVGKGLTSSLQLITRVLALYGLLLVAADVASRSGGPEATRDVLDGIGLAIRFEMVVVFVGLGWGSAAASVVGRNLGAKRPGRAARGAWWCLAWAVLSTAVLGLVIAQLDGEDLRRLVPGLAPLAGRSSADYFRFTVPAYPILMVGVVLSQALNGAGSTRSALLIDGLAYGLLMLILAREVAPRIGLAGCWTALLAAHGGAGLLYTLVFTIGRWKRKDLAGPAR